MSKKDFDIDQLEDRIAPSSVSLGSLADGVLQGTDASHAVSGDSVGSNNDPSIAGNTVDALMGNNASTGPVNTGISL